MPTPPAVSTESYRWQRAKAVTVYDTGSLVKGGGCEEKCEFRCPPRGGDPVIEMLNAWDVPIVFKKLFRLFSRVEENL